MSRDEMIQAVIDAMDNVSDMDTPWIRYAEVAVDALGWRKFSDEDPAPGAFIACTDGKARWIETHAHAGCVPEFSGHVATMWHPIHDIPPAA